MKEIRERIVDYELASMLKDAGFDVPVERVIYPDGTIMFIDENSVSRDKHIELPNSKLNIWDTCVSAPTLDMACEWMLSEKGIFVAVFCSTDGRWFSYRLYSDKGERFALLGDYGDEYKATDPVGARIMGLRSALTLELPMRDNGDGCLIKNDNMVKDNKKNFGKYGLAFNTEGKEGSPETVVMKRELQMDCKKDKRVILVTELLARIPYGVEVEHKESGFRGKVHKLMCYPRYDGNTICDYLLDIDFFSEGKGRDIDEFVLHLRPMSDMTESEKQELDIIWQYGEKYDAVDWFNAHHFDYRGLIKKGLAVTAPPDEYPEITASEK